MTATYTSAEVVLFRLNDGVSPQEFITAAAPLNDMLADHPDAGPRTLSHDGNGQWCDHILWTTRDAAEAGGKMLMSDPRARPMQALIDGASVSVSHAQVAATMD